MLSEDQRDTPIGGSSFDLRLFLSFLDCQFGCRICLKAFIGDWQSAADGAPIGSILEALFRSVDCRQAILESGRDVVVDFLGGKPFCRVSHVAVGVGRRSVILTRRLRLAK
jgi:hypothetical protein